MEALKAGISLNRSRRHVGIAISRVSLLLWSAPVPWQTLSVFICDMPWSPQVSVRWLGRKCFTSGFGWLCPVCWHWAEVECHGIAAPWNFEWEWIRETPILSLGTERWTVFFTQFVWIERWFKVNSHPNPEGPGFSQWSRPDGMINSFTWTKV